jgi:hypothetical protein
MEFVPQFFQNGRNAVFLTMMAVGLGMYGLKRCVRLVRSRA